MTPKIEILGQKFAHFGRFEGSFLTILGVKKVDFWTFSKLFWTCLALTSQIQILARPALSLHRIAFAPFIMLHHHRILGSLTPRVGCTGGKGIFRSSHQDSFTVRSSDNSALGAIPDGPGPDRLHSLTPTTIHNVSIKPRSLSPKGYH